jgi:hypothetical protein
VPAFGSCEALAGAVPLFEFAPDEFAFAPEAEVPDAAAPDCFPPSPFWTSDPELVLFVLPVACCGPAVVFELVVALDVELFALFPLLAPSLPLPAELFDGAGFCCGAGGGLAGAAGKFADPDMPASSNAANGCASMFWLCPDACTGDGEAREAAVEALGAILGTLGTLELREAT